MLGGGSARSERRKKEVKLLQKRNAWKFGKSEHPQRREGTKEKGQQFAKAPFRTGRAPVQFSVVCVSGRKSSLSPELSVKLRLFCW